jgi:transcriptional regulator with XRE-family HTH domain
LKLDPEKVRRALERLGYSAELGAAEAGVAKNSVLRAARGEDIRPSTARKIAAGLGVEVEELLEGKAAAPPSREQPSFNDLLEEERRIREQKIPESIEELLESAGAHSRLASMPDAAWRETIENADAEEARQIYGELEAERQATFVLRRVMFAQDDVEPRNLATRLTGRFMVRASQAALKAQDLSLTEEAELAAAEETLATT